MSILDAMKFPFYYIGLTFKVGNDTFKIVGLNGHGLNIDSFDIMKGNKIYTVDYDKVILKGNLKDYKKI